MKKVFLALVLVVFGVFFGVSAYANMSETTSETKTLRHMPVEEGADRQSYVDAFNYFYSCFESDENGEIIFPKTYGGYYVREDDVLIIEVTSSDFSEYLFLQEEFPCIEFEQVTYSWEYIWALYEETEKKYANTEGVYGVGFNMRKNRVVVNVDMETLAGKTNSPDSPIEYRLKGTMPNYSNACSDIAKDGGTSEGLSDADASTVKDEDHNLELHRLT